jgi:hypothetical protein
VSIILVLYVVANANDIWWTVAGFFLALFVAGDENDAEWEDSRALPSGCLFFVLRRGKRLGRIGSEDALAASFPTSPIFVFNFKKSAPFGVEDSLHELW